MCIFILSQQTFALDLDREDISVSYLDLPTHPMVNVEDRTYSVLYNAAYFENEFQQVVEENFHIQGFQKLFSGASMLIDFQFDEIKVLSTEVLSKTRKVKNSEGVSQIENYFVPVLKYKTNAQVIISYTGGKTKTYKFGSRSKKHKMEEKDSIDEANNFLNDDLNPILYDLFSQFVVETVEKTDLKLSTKHGYRVKETTDYLLVLDSRRYSEYKDYKRYYALANRLFKQMSPFESLSKIKDELQVVITFLEGIPDNYTDTKKADTKMRYASYYNLAKIHYYLDDLDQSIFYYQKVIENDYHKGQSKRNIKDIEKLKDLFSVNQVNTRHFPIELNLSSSQSNTQQDSFVYLDAEIQMTDNQMIDGKIELSALVGDSVSELQQTEVVKIKFLNDQDEIEAKNLSSGFIESIQLEDLKLQRISYASKSKNRQVNSGKVSKGTVIKGLAIEHYASDKVALYELNNELILKKPHETIGKSTSSTAFSFAFKKKLAAFFEDCTDIQLSIKSGTYKNNTESLIQAVKDYSQCQITKQ